MTTSLWNLLDGVAPNRDTALRAVNGDLFPEEGTEGLNPAFTPLSDPAVRLREGFEPDQLEDMLGPRLSAVPWETTVRHTGTFRGIPATQKLLLIVGVSILDLNARDEAGHEAGKLHRFVNWEEVMGQLGVVYAARASGPDEPVPTA
jgi:hypothetical protein